VYAIHLSRRAQRDILDLPVKEARRIRDALNELGAEPEPQTLVKKLKGHEQVPLYSYRVGRYRAILTIDRGVLVIFVITIDHRRSVYRNV